MSAGRRRPIALGLVAALAVTPTALAAPTAPSTPMPTPPRVAAATLRTAGLDAAAGWRDTLEGFRAPQLPAPGDTESVILLLRDPPAAAAPPRDRARAARAITRRQNALAPVLAGLGATVTFRYRMLLDGIAVRLPAGHLEALAALHQVASVVPVTYLAPARAGTGAAATPRVAAGAPTGRPGPRRPGAAPAHIALIDAGIDPTHPWLGGGMGPTFPIIGGADLVRRDGNPTADPFDIASEAHGTQMASLVLRSPALRGLPPSRAPRLLAYRVVAPEPVGGRLRPLARSDRVLAALERAVDPNLDGETRDAAKVILLGLAASFDGGGVDPVAQALAEADRVGATVVVPAGNDGPTYSRPGAVGGPAAVPTAIVAGGLSAGAGPRTAELQVLLGPASASLGPLPLMGPGPAAGPMPVAILRGPAGLAAGNTAQDYLGPDGRSLVQGALAVVGRGGGTVAEKAALARAAGAAALAVWDEVGPPGFPAVPGDAGIALATVGLGPSQGAALARLAGERPGLSVTLTALPVGSAPVTVASFSSWGPTADGRQKPDLVAPAVDRPAAWPGRGPGGAPMEVGLTGTSAAAAEVAAQALRLRVDRPDLTARAVHSLLVQSARPLAEVAPERQGAGQLATPGRPELMVDPPVVAPRRVRGAAVARVALGDLSGRPGRYRIAVRTRAGERAVGGPVRVAAGGRAAVRLVLPASDGDLIVRRADTGAVAATALVIPLRRATTPADALGRPAVRSDGGLPEVLVRLGLLRREDARVRSVRLHGVRLDLIPAAGGAPLPVSGAKQDGAWPAGTYRLLVARRLASGLDVPPGTYRVRVSGIGPDGRVLRRESAPVALR